MASQDDFIRTALRVPPSLHRRIHDAAADAGRTFNAEINARLEASFTGEDLKELKHQLAVAKAEASVQRAKSMIWGLVLAGIADRLPKGAFGEELIEETLASVRGRRIELMMESAESMIHDLKSTVTDFQNEVDAGRIKIVPSNFTLPSPPKDEIDKATEEALAAYRDSPENPERDVAPVVAAPRKGRLKLGMKPPPPKKSR